MLTHDEQYIRPEEASKILQVAPGTLRSWSLQGKLKFVITKGRHEGISEVVCSDTKSNVTQEKIRKKLKKKKFVMPVSQATVKSKIWIPSSNSSKTNTLITSVSKILDLDSISKGKDFCTYWTPQVKELSKELFLPIGTGDVVLILSKSLTSSS